MVQYFILTMADMVVMIFLIKELKELFGGFYKEFYKDIKSK